MTFPLQLSLLKITSVQPSSGALNGEVWRLRFTLGVDLLELSNYPLTKSLTAATTSFLAPGTPGTISSRCEDNATLRFVHRRLSRAVPIVHNIIPL